jgi:hypothetical protein
MFVEQMRHAKLLSIKLHLTKLPSIVAIIQPQQLTNAILLAKIKLLLQLYPPSSNSFAYTILLLASRMSLIEKLDLL